MVDFGGSGLGNRLRHYQPSEGLGRPKTAGASWEGDGTLALLTAYPVGGEHASMWLYLILLGRRYSTLYLGGWRGLVNVRWRFFMMGTVAPEKTAILYRMPSSHRPTLTRFATPFLIDTKGSSRGRARLLDDARG
jgi:hypothetical protein